MLPSGIGEDARLILASRAIRTFCYSYLSVVPTRQSYTMAVVAHEERNAAAGMTTMSRSIALIFSSPLLGYAF